MNRLKRLLLATVALGFAASGHAATVKSVSIEPDGADVRVVVTFDGRFEAPSAFALDAPRRLVVDLPGNNVATRSHPGQGPVTGARTAQFTADKARLVIDLDAPMAIAATVAADTSLTIILTAADAAAFAKLTRGRTRLSGSEAATPVEVARAEPPVRKVEPKLEPIAIGKLIDPQPEPVRVAVKAPVATTSWSKIEIRPTAPVQLAALSRNTTPVRAASPHRGYRPLVVIDAGNGGHDVGALSVVDQQREKDVTLAIARAIQREIEASGRVRVMLTRSDDRYLVHRERYEIARRHKAALFISVHADSAPVPEAHGATV